MAAGAGTNDPRTPIRRAMVDLEDREPSPTEIAWAAGLFEGEGCLTTGHANDPDRKHLMRMMLATTDRDVLERFAAIMRAGAITTVKRRIRAHHKQQWRWMVSASEDVLRCIDLLYPYLGSRRRARADELAIPLRNAVAEATKERACPTCGSIFSPRFGGNSAAQIFCSRTCGYRARNAQRRLTRRPHGRGADQLGLDL